VDEPTRGNPANPRSGTGLQHARDLRAEEAVEVVRNHGDGTRWWPGSHHPKERCFGIVPGVDARRQVERGAYTKDESQERKE
jgi:hypothetical protein